MFKEYSSITNSYAAKTIEYFEAIRPDLRSLRYTCTEKIDGANIQILNAPGQPMQVGRRNAFLQPGESFYSIWETLKFYDKELENINKYIDRTENTVRLYGEIFGPGVNGRINYGDKKRILFFDMMLNDVLLSHDEFSDMMHLLGLEHLIVPVLGHFESLEKALELPSDFKSHLSEDQAEGYVVVPTHENIFLPESGNRFILKNKSESFSETKKSGGQKTKPDQNNIDLINSYVNENRILSCFSKLGPIQDKKQIGQYVKHITEDVQKDFAADYPDLTARVESKKIVDLLMPYV